MTTATVSMQVSLSNGMLITGSESFTGTAETIVDETCPANTAAHDIDGVSIDRDELKVVALLATFDGGGYITVQFRKSGPTNMGSVQLTSGVLQYQKTSGVGYWLTDGDNVDVLVNTTTMTETGNTARLQLFAIHGTP